MLQVIISPAKQMQIDEGAVPPTDIPPFPHKTKQLHDALIALEKDSGRTALKSLWKVSDKLLEQCLDILHSFLPVSNKDDLESAAVSPYASSALFAYKGIQYQSMAPQVMDADTLSWLEEHLWILSGMYGCVRPFHAVEPYRLEMGAALQVEKARSVYEFWSAAIANEIARNCTELVNLASVEYAKAVLPYLDSTIPTTTIVFAEKLQNGRSVQRATASKIARGSMVRWMAENQVQTFDELRAFNLGYEFLSELSEDDRLVFLPSSFESGILDMACLWRQKTAKVADSFPVST